ncbi:hypothetical protein [Pseudomonas frederiksbergensis]|uniref:hypothetical protein n=1 Tax=Pseudomonas frederiksbergensis TaxID=104087 RepID=UPI001114E874|nr:hypothetical protein [Pseudomonas frederiksbergensis]
MFFLLKKNFQSACPVACRISDSDHQLHRRAVRHQVRDAHQRTLEERRKEEAKLVPRIRRVAKANISQMAIAEQLGISRMTLRRIGRFHGITLNSRTS